MLKREPAVSKAKLSDRANITMIIIAIIIMLVPITTPQPPSNAPTNPP